jgi:diguanylate cyclase (GGDEF)-like protein
MAEDRPSEASEDPRRSSRWVWALIALLAGSALALQVSTATATQPRAARPAAVALLVLGFVLAEVCVVHVTVRREAVSFAFAEIPWVLGLFVVSPGQLIAARVAGGALALIWHRRQNLLKLAFNLAQCWLGAVAAFAVWRVVLAGAAPESMRGWLAAVASAVTIEIVAALAITAVLAVRGDGPSGLPLALGTGTAASAANACFALVAHDVINTDWRGLWALAVLALFLGLAQRAHVTLLRRHDAMERLHAFTRRVGSSDLHVESVVHEIVAGVRELFDVRSVQLQLVDDMQRWTCDADGVQSETCASPLPAPMAAGGRRQRVDTLTVLLHGDVEPVGALTVSGRLGSVGGLQRSDLHLLEAVAGHAVVGLHNGRLADRLREQARANEHQALHDSLTDLPNRLLFDRTATAALATHEQSAVLLLDLDRFKEVNDTLGHAAGDAVLREVGRRLLEVLRGATCVARLGGDEFAVVLAGADQAEAELCAQRIATALALPLAVLGVTLALDASIGIALADDGGHDVDDLLRQADVAMYEAKDSHGCVAVYSPDRDHNSALRLSIAADLRAAIAHDELFLHFQPQAQTADGRVSSVEALVRWDSPTRGVVPPDEFIGIAEQTGLIGPLTEWVVAHALRQCRAWMDEGVDLSVAVNVSPRTLHDPAFVPMLTDQLAAGAVPAGRLVVEITEGAIMADPERAIDALWQLRRAGVRLSVDDLGAGHSSLTYLKRLPVHEVKVDRSFVTHMVDDPNDDAIVAAVIPLVHQLGMTVVAEGVEDERTWNRLVELGADAVQGFWLSRPQAAPAISGWLREREGSAAATVIPMPRRSAAANA